MPPKQAGMRGTQPRSIRGNCGDPCFIAKGAGSLPGMVLVEAWRMWVMAGDSHDLQLLLGFSGQQGFGHSIFLMWTVTYTKVCLHYGRYIDMDKIHF